MVDGQTRRTLRRKPTVARTDSAANGNDTRDVADESGTSSGTEPHASAHDRDTNAEPHRTVNDGVRVIEVDPANLGEFIARDAAESAAGSANGSDRSAAGSRRKYTRRTTRKETSQDLVPVLDMVHTLAAALLHAPEMLLDKDETKSVADAYSKFCEYHETPGLTPKRMSEIVLIGVALKVYGTRFVAIRNRKVAEKRETSNVTPMPQRATVSHAQPLM